MAYLGILWGNKKGGGGRKIGDRLQRCSGGLGSWHRYIYAHIIDIPVTYGFTYDLVVDIRNYGLMRGSGGNADMLERNSLSEGAARIGKLSKGQRQADKGRRSDLDKGRIGYVKYVTLSVYMPSHRYL